MAYLHVTSDKNTNDSDLEPGLPSPDASDDEQIKSSTDAGLTVPSFCNKLREQMKPLLGLSHGVPSPSKQLRENVGDRFKESSKAKKRLFKGKQQPSSGVIERRYGYIPNPRWPKPFSYTRSYEPVGVGDEDREGIPGVVFRTKQNRKLEGNERKNYEHSYHESDFPMLNISAMDRSQKSDVSVASISMLNSTSSENRFSTPASSLRNEPPSVHTDSASNPSCNMRSVSAFGSGVSPTTSTPIKQGNSVHHLAPSPLASLAESSTCTSDSADSTPSSVTGCVVSNPASGRMCKKNSHMPLTRRSPNVSFPVLDCDSSCSSKHDESGNSRVADRSNPWSSVKRPAVSPSVAFESGTNFREDDSFPPLHKPSDVNHSCNTDVAPLKQLSPVTVARSSENECSFHITCSLSTTAGDAGKPTVVSSRSAWSNFTRGSPGENGQIASPKPLSPEDQVISCTESSAITSEHLVTTSHSSSSVKQKNQSELGKSQKVAVRGNRKFKASHISPSREPNSGKLPASSSNAGSQNRIPSHGRGSNRSGYICPRSLTLESFIVPQKNAKKKNGIPDGKKDFSSFQNRFVEQLSANPVSPPKKVRPSPIKRLSFSKNEDTVAAEDRHVSDSGDGKKTADLHNDAKELETVEWNVEKKLDDNGDNADTLHIKFKGKAKAAVQQEKNYKGSTKQQSKPVISLERLLKARNVQEQKDIFEEELESECECPKNDGSEPPKNDSLKDAEAFWMPGSVNRRVPLPVSTGNLQVFCESDDDSDDVPACVLTSRQVPDLVVEKTVTGDDSKQAILSKVTHKSVLRKYARRYCHFIEEHQVPNIAVELYFTIQLLTCTDVDAELLSRFDRSGRKTYFHSVHNGVYFAVRVIKRLRRLFLALDKTYLELLAACPRIQEFSPRLHDFLVQAVKDKTRDPVAPCLIEHIPFNPQDDGSMSFPDTNTAHVFKCQRDNFYAFYRHYHDTSSVYEFRIENQIQYVYDGCTPEQNSVTNLIHLAKLYLDHMILCCVKQTEERVDILRMIQSKTQDEKLFTKLYETFTETVNSSGACPLPGFCDSQMFFKDFIETLSCPAFNEHLRNLVVFRILELNSSSFCNVMDLHSAATVADDRTPLRTEKFTETVKTLCVLGKLLGYLTFSPHRVGAQNIPNDQATLLLTLREMSPIPLPLPLLLKQAFDDRHLCLTVPWMVEYLAMMDQMAPQLSVYDALLRKLHFIQRYAWTALYKEGHDYAGLLIVSCISWLFETPAVPGSLFFSYNNNEEIVKHTESSHSFHIDVQKLVSQQLLTFCCPYLEQGKVLLTLFILKQGSASAAQNVLPVSQLECSRESAAPTRMCREISEIEKWLGTSFGQETDIYKKRHTNIIDDEVVPAYVLTRLLARKDVDDLEDLEVHLIQNNPALKVAIDTTVSLLCAKVVDYTHKIILKLLVFEAKAETRKLFLKEISSGLEVDAIKDKVIVQVNITAKLYSEKARESFQTVCERICGKELSDLLLFLASHAGEDVRSSAVHIARKMSVRRLQEWADVQLGPALFRRTIIREAEKSAKSNHKHLSLYPNDHSKKQEDLSCPELKPGFTEQDQLSELIDKVLSYGVWYINALSPGVQPHDEQMVQLIQDLINCVEKKLITMDFAFFVTTNILMHLIIQFIVDAPENWTSRAEDAFIHLCCLCKEMSLEHGKMSTAVSDLKRKRLKVKVLNLLSVYSVHWLTKSEKQLETLMAYCRLLYRLVYVQLIYVETMYRKLTCTRDNRNLDSHAKIMVNRVLVKVLEMLFESGTDELESFTSGRIVKLVEDLAGCLIATEEAEWDDVLSDLAVCVKSTFGCVLGPSFECILH